MFDDILSTVESRVLIKPDPAVTQGTEEERLEVFRSVRDRLRNYIEDELVNGSGG